MGSEQLECLLIAGGDVKWCHILENCLAVSFKVIHDPVIPFLGIYPKEMKICGLVAKPCPTLVTPWTAACQAPLSMGFSRQEYCGGLPCPPPRELPHPGIKPASPVSPALAGKFFTTSTTWEAPNLPWVALLQNKVQT